MLEEAIRVVFLRSFRLVFAWFLYSFRMFFV